MSVLIVRYDSVNYSSEVSPDVFESHILLLKKSGFSPVTLREIYDYIAGEGDLPDRAVHLSFDCGYADVFIYAYPILRRHNFLASVFPIPGKVTFSGRRATFEELVDVGLSDKVEELLRQSKYVGWGELREMCESGVFEVGSHSLTHGACFCSDNVVGFNDSHVDEWFYELTGDRRLGIPIYEHRWNCVTECVADDPVLRDAMHEFVRRKGGLLFFRRKDANAVLLKEFRRLRKKRGVKFKRESRNDRIKRLNEEVLASKEMIEDKLGRSVLFFSYPWGDFDDYVIDSLVEAGYSGSLTLIEGINLRGTDPFKVKRFKARGSTEWFDRVIKLAKRDVLAFVFSKVSGK